MNEEFAKITHEIPGIPYEFIVYDLTNIYSSMIHDNQDVISKAILRHAKESLRKYNSENATIIEQS